MAEALTITITGSGLNDQSTWLNLEQEPLSPWENALTPADLVSMVTSAMSGLSSNVYTSSRCPGAVVGRDGEITVTLGMYVWPSSLSLAYQLVPAGCVLGNVSAVDEWREQDVAFDGSDTAELPFLMTNATVSWQTDCYNERSEVIPSPALRVAGNQVRAAASCWGVARIKGEAHGYHHAVILRFLKITENEGDHTWESIDQLKISVTATWDDANAKKQGTILELHLPSCVSELLRLCPSGKPRIISLFGPNPDGKKLKVYYDACRGDVLRSVYVDDK